MRLTINETDLIIEALSRRAARLECMADDDDFSVATQTKYENRAAAMRALRDKFKAMKSENKPMAVDAA